MYHLHLDEAIRVCAIRSVACAGRWWRAVNASRRGSSRYPCTDRSARATRFDANLAVRLRDRVVKREVPSGERRKSSRGCREPLLRSQKGCVIDNVSTTAIVVGGSRRRATPRAERGRKRGGKLASIEAGDSSHAHPGGSCVRGRPRSKRRQGEAGKEVEYREKDKKISRSKQQRGQAIVTRLEQTQEDIIIHRDD